VAARRSSFPKGAFVFEEKDITKDPSAVDELEKLGAMTTPVIVNDGEVVIGLWKRLEELLA
jgi:glutaredoxin